MSVCLDCRGEWYFCLLILVNLSVFGGSEKRRAVRAELGKTEAMVLLKNVDSVFNFCVISGIDY
jgi:hypothetical protein